MEEVKEVLKDEDREVTPTQSSRNETGSASGSLGVRTKMTLNQFFFFAMLYLLQTGYPSYA